jgi:hypothetical protein
VSERQSMLRHCCWVLLASACVFRSATNAMLCSVTSILLRGVPEHTRHGAAATARGGAGSLNRPSATTTGDGCGVKKNRPGLWDRCRQRLARRAIDGVVFACPYAGRVRALVAPPIVRVLAADRGWAMERLQLGHRGPGTRLHRLAPAAVT